MSDPVKNLNAAITLLLSLTAQAAKVSALISAARDAGRDLSDAEVAGLKDADDAARAALAAAIVAAQ